MFKRFFEAPLTRGYDLDSPETTELRKSIINSKPFLREIYREWYLSLLSEIEAESTPGQILELGSGAGFLQQLAPHVIRSDLLFVTDLDLMTDAQNLPFRNSLAGILLVNVLHHIPNPRAFFEQASISVSVGGKIVMIEPWITPWSLFVYRRLHHEPVIPEAPYWTIQGEGPLTAANTALPWIIFARDRERFEREFPKWQISSIRPFMPFRYLLSGGISMRSFMFSRAFGFWRSLEHMLDPWMAKLAMFAKIVIIRKE